MNYTMQEEGILLLFAQIHSQLPDEPPQVMILKLARCLLTNLTYSGGEVNKLNNPDICLRIIDAAFKSLGY